MDEETRGYFDEIRSQLVILDGKVTTLDGKVTTLETKVGMLDGRVAALDRKIDSRVGGLEEVVVDGETGTLVPPDDEEALASAVEVLLADEDLRRRMGASGQRRARAVFDWHEGLEEYERLYEEASCP